MAAFVTPFSRWRSGNPVPLSALGATVVIPDSNQNWQNQLHQLAITHLSVVPTQLFRMMENDEEQISEINENDFARRGGSIPWIN